MAATIGANGLSVVHKGSGGEASADSPDVCATTTGKSTSNIAYGNSAKSSDLAGGSTTVTMDGGNSVALKGSIFSKSTGDEGGDKKGVSSGTIQGEAAFITASPTVKIEGQGVARQSDSMTMNSGNTLCSGVQNPSFQIGTPEPETYSVNIYCENLANAPFKVKDGDGNIVASGELDGRGKCTLDPLPEDMRLEVEYEESPNEFNWGPGPVDFNQRYGELSDDAFFSLAAGSQYPFWLRKPNSRAEQYQWGILGSQTYPNETLQSIIELEAKYLSPQLFTYWDAQEFATSLLKVMDKEPMEQKDVRYFVSQLLCIASPNISTSVYADAIYSFIWLDASTSYGELWANLRYFGKGNPQKAWDSLDWSAAAQHINKVADAFFERFLSRLECVKGNASLVRSSEVEKVTLGHIDTVKRVRKQLIDETQTLLDNTKAKIQGIIDKGGDKPSVVKRPNQIVASAYELNDKLYIQAPKLDKAKMELDNSFDVDDTYIVFSDSKITIEDFVKETYLSAEPEVIEHFIKSNPHLKRSFHQIVEGMPLVVSPWKDPHQDEAYAIEQTDELMTEFLTLSSDEKKWFSEHHETTANALLMVATSNLDINKGNSENSELIDFSLSHMLAGSGAVIAGAQVQGDKISKKMTNFSEYSKIIAEKTKGLSGPSLYSNYDYKEWRGRARAFQKEMKSIISEVGSPSYIKSIQTKNINRYLNVDKRQLYKAKDFAKSVSGIDMTALYKQSMSFSKGLGIGSWLVTGLGLYGNGKDIYQTCSMNDVISEACGRTVTKNLSSATVNVLGGLGIGAVFAPVTGGLSIVLIGGGSLLWGMYGGDISNDIGVIMEDFIFD
ncbi:MULTISPECIES: DUF4150 domain-containing protein [Aliivibrio]|uniref:DUF4150 domain-containing protein n=1 Tax=Aliivibrio TaxID=511678 RepID=UPI001F5C3DE5|nr:MULTISPECIES: DUF4150 domain-containing protein [Aliivibrio]MDD9180266.1 DUF4150 domain-containing protein [Aliivibrio sp. A6]